MASISCTWSVPKLLHSLVWPCACLYSVWRLHCALARAAPILAPSTTIDVDTNSWWSLISSSSVDDELRVIVVQRAPLLLLWTSVQLALSRVLVTSTRFCREQRLFWLPLLHAVVGACFLLSVVGWWRVLVLLSVLIVYYPAVWLGRRWLAWLMLISIVLGYQFSWQDSVSSVYTPHHDDGNDDDDAWLYTSMVLMWCLCRLLMMACTHQHQQSVSLSVYCGFALYTPTLSGPLLPYQQYLTSLTCPTPKPTRVSHVVFRCVRLLFWFVVLCVANRVLDFHTLCRLAEEDTVFTGGYASERGHDWANRVLTDRWAWAGLIYWAGQYFHVKYVLVYGLGATLASLDGINAVPRPPRCVAVITSYSHMWQHFDSGLYVFMRDYIYVPLCGVKAGRLRRLGAVSLVFVFVYVWHGANWLLFQWTLCNWLCLLVERVLDRIVVAVPKNDGGGERRREVLKAVLHAPLFMLSMSCQTGFLCDSQSVGNWALWHTLSPPSWIGLATPLFCCYCACRLSYGVDRWRRRRAITDKTKHR